MLPTWRVILKGVVLHFDSRWCQGGVTHLQYANDTIIPLQLDDSCLANQKFLLICHEIISRLKINFLKSEVIVMVAPPQEQARVANLLN
jgi:hypothetical protein